MITIIEKQAMEQVEERKGNLEEQTEERKVKRSYDALMDMSRAASDKAYEIIKKNDPKYDDAVAAIFDFKEKELRFIYAN